MKTDLKKPCSECPFRKVSPPSYLGPWTAWELLQEINDDRPFPCHMTIKKDEDDMDDLQSCAGTALFLANKCKLSRDRSTATHQAKLRSEPGYEALKAGVIGCDRTWLQWHLPDNRSANFAKLREMQSCK